MTLMPGSMRFLRFLTRKISSISMTSFSTRLMTAKFTGNLKGSGSQAELILSWIHLNEILYDFRMSFHYFIFFFMGCLMTVLSLSGFVLRTSLKPFRVILKAPQYDE